jgi:hypothetical protein
MATVMAGGHRQQSTKSSSKDTVAVATVMERAAEGAATTAVGMPRNDPGIGADGIAFATAVGTETTAIGAATSATNRARTAWLFWRGEALSLGLSAQDRDTVQQAEEEECTKSNLRRVTD